MNNPTAISLFSGMGGDSLGMERAGFDVIAFNEFDKAGILTHKANFPNSILIQDETQKKEKDKTNIQKIPDSVFLDYRDKVDLVFAGHPCQGFSNGGKKLPDDPRNTLFKEFARVCSLVRPKYLIGENVDGLLSRKTSTGEKYFDVICKEFDDIGYEISHQVCHAVRYGVPQLRKRLVYVGVRKDLEKKNYVFPEPQNDGKTNLPNLKNIVSFSMEGAIKINDDDFDMQTIPPECILKDEKNVENGNENVHPYLKLKAKTRDTEYSGKTHHTMLSFQKRDSPIHSEIIDIRNPSKTIICTYDHQPRLYVALENGNGYFLRCLLPDELKQIQGFPRNFILCGSLKDKIKQIGNAAPPPLIELIAKQFLVMN
jgi:DNA (cytosine-5)-methyltransferase 1